MKIVYLLAAAGITIAILIIAFQNIAVTTQFWMFFKAENIPMTLPIMFLTVFGMVAGSLYTLFIQSVWSKKVELEREENEGEF